jgi:hypothetical protein
MTEKEDSRHKRSSQHSSESEQERQLLSQNNNNDNILAAIGILTKEPSLQRKNSLVTFFCFSLIHTWLHCCRQISPYGLNGATRKSCYRLVTRAPK